MLKARLSPRGRVPAAKDMNEVSWGIQQDGSGQVKPNFSQKGYGFENEDSMCLLSDLHYKLIMNQKPQKKGKTEVLSYRCQVQPLQTTCAHAAALAHDYPSGEGSYGIWTDRCHCS